VGVPHLFSLHPGSPIFPFALVLSVWAAYPFTAARYSGLVRIRSDGARSQRGVAAWLLALLLGMAWQAARLWWTDKIAIVLGTGVATALFTILDVGGLGWIAARFTRWVGCWARS
jgi:hypothetical protein